MSEFKSKIFICSLFCFLITSMEGCISSQKMQNENTRKLIASNSGNSGQFTTTADSLYRIKRGDEVEILVWGNPNFNTTTKVTNLGTVAVPFVGEVPAKGMTNDEFKEQLRKELSKYIKDDINLSVSVSNTDNMFVSVLGMVTRPDSYPVKEQTSIFKILSMAGGASDDANIRRVRIYRNDGNANYTTLDLTHYLETGQLKTVLMVNPGDIVYVPKKNNAVREVSGFLGDVLLLFGVFRFLN